MLLYSALLVLVLLVGAPYWLLRMTVSGRYRAGLSGRLGLVPAELREAVRGREVVWLHAVSVGEVMAAVEVVRGLAAAWPELVVAVSTTTKTGQELAKRRMEGMPVFYLPLDFGYSVRRYLGVLQPRMLVLMESEFWPNLLRECGRAGVPVVVANARVSDRSFPRYMRLRKLWRPLLEGVALFLPQGEETAERLQAMGVDAERVRVVGNLKYDVRAVAESAMVERLRSDLPDGAKLVVCGSTLEGEEAMLLTAWPEIVGAEPLAVMVLAPRHPERFGRVVELARSAGLTVWRASELRAPGYWDGVERSTSLTRVPSASSEQAPGPTRVEGGDVVVLDTIGDLAAVYSLGTVAFVGGSLVTAGGHNPLEPARFGVPVVIGSSFNNFREVVERMLALEGIRVVTPEEVQGTIRDLLHDAMTAHALGQRGLAVFQAESGATARTVEKLLNIPGVMGLEGEG